MEIFKVKAFRRKSKYDNYTICPNDDFIHLKDGVFLWNFNNGIYDYEDLENENHEILELPSEETEKQFKRIKQLIKLKER